MKAQLLNNISIAEYEADPCSTPSLNPSVAHVLVSESPLHAWSAHPKLGGHRRPSTKEQDSGTILHSLLLGAGEEKIYVMPDKFKDFKSGIARSIRDEQISFGKIPIIAEKYQELVNAAAPISIALECRGVRFDGATEQVFVWEETADDGTSVLCRCRMDHNLASRTHPIIDDLKTSKMSVNPHKLSMWAATYGWDLRSAAYISAFEKTYPELAGRVRFRFICAETNPPNDVVIGTLDGTFRQMGHMKWRRAINLWAQCLRSGKWPGYAEEEIRIQAPPWLMKEEILEGTYQSDTTSEFLEELKPEEDPFQGGKIA